MTNNDAVLKLRTCIISDAEAVIAKAIAEKPGTDRLVDDLRKVPGAIEGIAAAATRYALTGVDRAATEANIARFVAAL
jgi:hypothetical protein